MLTMLISLIEITVTILIIVGLFNEDKLVEFEQKIITKWRKH